MLDVHPPHHTPNTWRDFLIHIATIVVGLLIAIGLEQTVEAIHHRHIVHVARENILREVEANEKQAAEDIGYLRKDADAMKGNVAVARTLRDAPRSKGLSMSFRFTWSSFNSSAWTSARDSGALTSMAPEEVQRYADVYTQQQIVNDEAVKIFTDQVQLAAPMRIEAPGVPTSPQDLHDVMLGCAKVGVRLETLVQITEQLAAQYKGLLNR